MADREVANSNTEIADIPDILEKLLLYSINEAHGKMDDDEGLVPFTIVAVKNNLFIESHPGETTEQCYASAQHTVEGMRGSDAYSFTYDGYLETNQGMKSAIISEGGVPGDDHGYAIGLLYIDDDEGKPRFEEAAAFLGEAPNFMSKLKDSTEYGEEPENEYQDIEDNTEEDSQDGEMQ